MLSSSITITRAIAWTSFLVVRCFVAFKLARARGGQAPSAKDAERALAAVERAAALLDDDVVRAAHELL